MKFLLTRRLLLALGIGVAFLAFRPATAQAQQLTASPITIFSSATLQFNWAGGVAPYTATAYWGEGISSTTDNVFWEYSTFSPNTQYALSLVDHTDPIQQEIFINGYTIASTPTVTSFSTYTFSAPATSIYWSSSTIIFNWDANNNGDGTVYQVLMSTDPGLGLSVSTMSSTESTVLISSTGLNANTTYYFEVQALNTCPQPWSCTAPEYCYCQPGQTGYTTAIATSTLADKPTNPGLTMVALSSITFSWASDNSPGTLFTVMVATADFSQLPPGAVVTTSATYNTSLSSTGLTADTTYYFQVAAINNNGIMTPFARLISTATLANAPNILGFPMVGLSSITFAWSSANPNPDAPYTVLVATVSNPSSFPAGAVVTASTTYNTSFSSSGLNIDTTYYFQVAAINVNGIPSPFTSTAAAATQAYAPANSSFTMVGLSSITFAWSQGNATADAPYTVLVATVPNPSSFPPGAVVTTSTTYNTFLSSSGLNANTSYYFQVAGTDVNGSLTRFTTAVATATLANTPNILGFSMVTLSSITFSWSSANANPDVPYMVLVATVPNPSSFPPGAVVTTSVTYNTFFSSAGLNASTPYYFQVAATNMNGIISSYTASASTATLSFVPAISSFTMVGLSSITFSWSAPGGISAQYNVLTSTDPNPQADASGAVVTASATYNTFLSSSGLNANTTYYFQVAIIQNGGLNYTTAIGTATLAYPPTTAVTTFTAVYITSVSVAWSANSNAVGVATYTVVLTTSPVFPNSLSGNVILSTAQAGSSPTTTLTNLGAGATYYLFVDARNWNNVSSGYVFLGSTATPSSIALQICPVGGTMNLNTVDGDIIVVFPPNTFSTCVQVALGVATSNCPAPVSNATTLTPVGVCAMMTIAGAALPAQPIWMSVGYRLGDLPLGIDARQLILAYYAPQNTWVPMSPDSSQGSNPVTAQWPTSLLISQMSYFQLMASIPTTSLSNGKVYPNPFRPALGHSAITFSQMPANSRIRIYTIVGELVKDLDTDATGMARWDATNKNGQSVASGAYFALVQADGSKIILKVLIQR
jgi:hypothetical protein